MTLKDRIANKKSNRYFQDAQLPNIPRVVTFEDFFNIPSWEKGSPRKWLPRETWGRLHPDKPYHYYGPPTIIENEGSNFARLAMRYSPQIVIEDGVPYDMKWQGGFLSAQPFFRQQFGRFQASIRPHLTEDVRFAWWLWSAHTDAEDKELIEKAKNSFKWKVVLFFKRLLKRMRSWYSEFDIIEVDGLAGLQKINTLYRHKGSRRKVSGKAEQNTLLQDEWQTFTMDWRKEGIFVYVDGLKVYQMTNKRILKIINTPGRAMWPMLNIALLKHKELDGETTIGYMDVDYVRISQFSEYMIKTEDNA